MNVERLVNVEEIESAVLSVCYHVEEKYEKHINWRDFSEEKLWFELVSCILGSRVNYETANACTFYLFNQGLLNPLDIIKNPSKFEQKMAYELSKPIFPPLNENKGRCYPFSKSKSNYIVRTAVNVYKTADTTLKDILLGCQNEYDARNSLKEIAVGIGYKQASLFLRNISYSKNLAVLDSHVMRYMLLLNLVEKDKAFRLSSKNEYVKLERLLQIYALSNKKPIAALDIAIWVVMRLIQKEYLIWL
jgi:N-glycosylase/DNA lyase